MDNGWSTELWDHSPEGIGAWSTLYTVRLTYQEQLFGFVRPVYLARQCQRPAIGGAVAASAGSMHVWLGRFAQPASPQRTAELLRESGGRQPGRQESRYYGELATSCSLSSKQMLRPSFPPSFLQKKCGPFTGLGTTTTKRKNDQTKGQNEHKEEAREVCQSQRESLVLICSFVVSLYARFCSLPKLVSDQPTFSKTQTAKRTHFKINKRRSVLPKEIV